MKILVLNSGSSSVKYSVFDMAKEVKLVFGRVEKIGTSNATIYHQIRGKSPYIRSKLRLDHKEGLHALFRFLVDSEHGIFNDFDELDAVGHRVVHGGSRFLRPILIDEKVIQGIQEMYPFAPLHNPPNVEGIWWVKKYLPTMKQVAVFDTSFHQTMPKYAYLYGLPKKISKKYAIRKYGFHGISHAYVAQQAARFLGQKMSNLKMITCHIGNGVSITAIDRGISIDTSMGLTPLEGVLMGTRSGSIDPFIIPYLMKKKGVSPEKIVEMLNRESGLLGISGISYDMRELIDAKVKGDKDAKLAIEMYVYQIKKMIGSFLPVLGGVDAFVFTAGVGESAPLIRERICGAFDFLGVDLDHEKNFSFQSHTRRISSPTSKVEVLVIPTNEELMIAKETKMLVEAESPC